MKQIAIDLSPPGGFQGPSGGFLSNPQGGAVGIFTKFISSVVALLTVVAIIWFVFSFITGAIGIISSGGDKASLESARKKIANSIIGLIVTIAAIFVIRLLGYLIGVNFLDIGALLNLK